MEDLRCICHTDQGTRWQIERRQCLAIAMNGIYNPFREPISRGRMTNYEAERPTPTRGGQASVAAGETQNDADNVSIVAKSLMSSAARPPIPRVARLRPGHIGTA